MLNKTRNKKNPSRTLVFFVNFNLFLFISGIKLTFIFKKKKIIKYGLYARFYLLQKLWSYNNS